MPPQVTVHLLFLNFGPCANRRTDVVDRRSKVEDEFEIFPHGGVPVRYSPNKRIRDGTVDKHVCRQCDDREKRCDGVPVRKWNLRVREGCNDSAPEHWFIYGKTVD